MLRMLKSEKYTIFNVESNSHFRWQIQFPATLQPASIEGHPFHRKAKDVQQLTCDPFICCTWLISFLICKHRLHVGINVYFNQFGLQSEVQYAIHLFSQLFLLNWKRTNKNWMGDENFITFQSCLIQYSIWGGFERQTYKS